MVRHSCEGTEAGTCVHTEKVKENNYLVYMQWNLVELYFLLS